MNFLDIKSEEGKVIFNRYVKRSLVFDLFGDLTSKKEVTQIDVPFYEEIK